MTQPTAPVREAAIIIAEILTAQLGLAPGQIMLTNQRWEIPETQGLFVAISYVSGKPIGNTNEVVPTDGGMQENQAILMLYDLQIDLMSYDDSARVKKEIAYMGLLSVASQQIQEQYSVQVYRNPQPFQDVSELEESGRLIRYTTTVRLTQLVRNTITTVPYYDDFSEAVPPTLAEQQ